MKKLTKILSFAIAFVCFSLCFAGCSFNLGQKPTLESIDIKGSIQTEYAINERLNLNGAKLILTYSNDSQKELDVTASMVSGFDTTTAGNKTLTITYKEKTARVDYIVKNEYLIGNKRLKCGEYYQQEEYTIEQDGSITLKTSYVYSNTLMRLTLNNNFEGKFLQRYSTDTPIKEFPIIWEIQDNKIVLTYTGNGSSINLSITSDGTLRLENETTIDIFAYHE